MAKGKNPPTTKGAAKDAANDGGKTAEIFDADTRRAQLRVAKMRDKLRKAMDDPEMRKQMVNAMRMMMQDDK